MKTPLDYLAAEFNAITRMDLSGIPQTELVHQYIKALQILIDHNVGEDSIARIAIGYALELRDSTFRMYA